MWARLCIVSLLLYTYIYSISFYHYNYYLILILRLYISRFNICNLLILFCSWYINDLVSLFTSCARLLLQHYMDSINICSFIIVLSFEDLETGVFQNMFVQLHHMKLLCLVLYFIYHWCNLFVVFTKIFKGKCHQLFASIISFPSSSMHK